MYSREDDDVNDDVDVDDDVDDVADDEDVNDDVDDVDDSRSACCSRSLAVRGRPSGKQ